MATPEHRPDLRASDADREAVANQLRTASEDGRLDVDELDDRLAKVYAAKTYGELEPLTADLAPDPPPPPSALANWRVRWGSWAATSVLLVGIWAIVSVTSGDLTFFWPIFPIGFWALGNIAAMISGDDGTQSERSEGHT
ncbi:DUF1707 SHOCT-like domain-containing protein [Capillimicrobium parvum]|uniref:DUF1707 domain-containing protein n=1 Tax=Capillimicrobium parvum TaxID=2884022 RepID=A0A9E6Y1A6_9ACTN|nr:DUF1707 domain-containing protein [Capillimicrobium parvum]UGS37823.1 hypothetical protein DSM104329_04244 [Capillimicrobium parvum]